LAFYSLDLSIQPAAGRLNIFFAFQGWVVLDEKRIFVKLPAILFLESVLSIDLSTKV
jgi:hypothetical protein